MPTWPLKFGSFKASSWLDLIAFKIWGMEFKKMANIVSATLEADMVYMLMRK